MNPERSTDSESPLSFLNIVERGGTAEWRALHERCRDRTVAAQLARALPMTTPELAGSARLWKYLLEELHPDLRVELSEAGGADHDLPC